MSTTSKPSTTKQYQIEVVVPGEFSVKPLPPKEKKQEKEESSEEKYRGSSSLFSLLEFF
jgi:hypothetical protein